MSTFANTDCQISLFLGCHYDLEKNRIQIPFGPLVTKAQFDVMYGGFTFTMDNANEKTTRSAWKAFTQNQAYRCPMVPGMRIAKHDGDGERFANVDSQVYLFNGCSYDLSSGKAVLPNGMKLNKSQFDVMYGGYTFALDEGCTYSTTSAWRAFTSNRAIRPVIRFK